MFYMLYVGGFCLALAILAWVRREMGASREPGSPTPLLHPLHYSAPGYTASGGPTWGELLLSFNHTIDTYSP